MSLVSFPSTAIELFAGPLTTIGTTDYDLMQLEQAAVWDADTSGQRNFYDGALAYYIIYYRTGDPQWATRADFLAAEHADMQMLPANLDGGGRSNRAGRDYSTLGMAIHYLRTGYANSLAAVRAQAAGGLWYFSPFTVPSSRDARESAYALMAMIATTVLGGDPNSYTTGMAAALNAYFDRQGVDDTAGGLQPNDAWQAFGSTVGPDDRYILNYMQGLVMEALILYDRAIGDARIVPSIKRAVDWLWTTQWVPLGGGLGGTDGTSTTSVTVGTGTKVFTTQAGLTIAAGQQLQIHRTATNTVHMAGTATTYSGTTLTVNVTSIKGSGTFTDWTVQIAAYPGDQTTTGIGTFQYGNYIGGDVHLQSNDNYSNLMGLIVPAFGYCYLKGQGVSYNTNGTAIIDAMQQSTWFLVKQFLEAFRSSPRHLGYVASADETTLQAPRYAAATIGGTY